MMLQLRFAPRFSAAIRAYEKTLSFRLGAPRAKNGDRIQLIESGTGALLLDSWIIATMPVTIRRGICSAGRPQIKGILMDDCYELGVTHRETLARMDGFKANEPGCSSASEAMAQFFATIYPGTELYPGGATLHGHITVWADPRPMPDIRIDASAGGIIEGGLFGWQLGPRPDKRINAGIDIRTAEATDGAVRARHLGPR